MQTSTIPALGPNAVSNAAVNNGAINKGAADRGPADKGAASVLNAGQKTDGDSTAGGTSSAQGTDFAALLAALQTPVDAGSATDALVGAGKPPATTRPSAGDEAAGEPTAEPTLPQGAVVAPTVAALNAGLNAGEMDAAGLQRPATEPPSAVLPTADTPLAWLSAPGGSNNNLGANSETDAATTRSSVPGSASTTAPGTPATTAIATPVTALATTPATTPATTSATAALQAGAQNSPAGATRTGDAALASQANSTGLGGDSGVDTSADTSVEEAKHYRSATSVERAAGDGSSRTGEAGNNQGLAATGAEARAASAGRGAGAPNAGLAPVLSAPLASPAWQAQLGQQVGALHQRGLQQVELQLHPADLGPLAISLKVDEQGAQAQFLSAHASVRSAVEQAIPQLREALAQQGIALADASVSDQPGRDQAGSDQAGGQSERNSGSALFAPGEADEAASAALANPASAASLRSGIDLYA